MASSERTEAAHATSTSTAASSTPTASAAPANAAGEEGRRNGERQLSGAEAAAPTLKDGLRCDLLMNAQYHSSREAFLDTVHRILMFSIIVLGAAAVTDLFNAPWIKGVFSACAVIFAAIDLTADLSNRARCHAMMKRRYFDLLAKLTATNADLAEIEADMHRCSADEEPAFHALLSVCWNAAQEMVYGDSADVRVIPFRHRLLKNIRRYGQKYRTLKGPRLGLQASAA